MVGCIRRSRYFPLDVGVDAGDPLGGHGRVRVRGADVRVIRHAWRQASWLASLNASAEPEILTLLADKKVTVDEDLTSITGIGPAYAARLKEANIDTFAKLAKAGVEKVAEAAKVRAELAEKWIAEAKTR